LDELASQPLIYARLAVTLGRIYIGLNDFPRARALLESSLAIRRRELGESHPDVAASCVAVADVLGRMGEREAAFDLLHKSLEIRRAYYGEPHEQVAASLQELGRAHYYHQEHEAAVDYLQQSLDMRRALGAEDRLEVAQSLHSLGSALTALRRLDEAEQTLLRALAIKQRLSRPGICADAVSISLTFEALAHIAYPRGDSKAAESYVAEQVEAVRRGCPDGHPMVAWALNNYGFLVDKNRGPAAAEPIYREALAIRMAAFGEQHLEVAGSLNHLAQMRLAQDDPVEALELNGRALAIRRALLGENADMVAWTLHTQGQAWRRAGVFDEAESALLEGYAIFTANHGEHSKQSRAIVQALIALYDEQDQCALADEWRGELAFLGPAN
jgi:tetratricopeptide (TPR) repeat protein